MVCFAKIIIKIMCLINDSKSTGIFAIYSYPGDKYVCKDGDPHEVGIIMIKQKKL